MSSPSERRPAAAAGGVPRLAAAPRAKQRRTAARGLALALALAATPACEREERRFQPADGANPPGPATVAYDETAYGIAEGKRLFVWFNCIGCHALGGGGMGPPLLDDEWRYGSEPADIFATIMDGRPNGMPSFRGRMPEQYAWRLVAYVRSMSGLVPLDRRPGRTDDMHVKAPEVLKDAEAPTLTGPPPPPPGASDSVVIIRAGGTP